MKVLISFIRDVKGGNEKYTIELIKYLNNIKFIDLAVIVVPEKADLCRDIAPFARVYPVKMWAYPLSICQEAYVLKKYISLESPDIFHSPTTLLPFWRPSCKTVVTIHDLNFLTLKSGIIKKIYKKMLYGFAAKRSDNIVCVSEYTSNVLRKYYPKSNNKITILWEGYDPICKEVNGTESYGNSDPYIISFGHWAHKNVEDSVRILVKLISMGCSLRLKLIGDGNYLEKHVKSFVLDEGMTSHVDFLGRVPESELDDLYRNAKALVFLSKYEGFGLPVLEAMSRLCPVITSNCGSLPEVVKNYGFIMAEDAIDEGAEYLYNLINDDAFNEEVTQRAYNYARKLTWAYCFKKLVSNVYVS